MQNETDDEYKTDKRVRGMHASDQRIRELLLEVHEKDKMLANFHSELLFDLDFSATMTPGFRFQRKPADRMHSSYSDGNIIKCLRLLNVHDEESLFDSICTLKRELTIASNECDSMKETVLHLQEKLEMCEGTLSLNEEVYRRKDAEFQSTLESLHTGKHRSALDSASLQEQAVFCQAVFDRLEVSNYADAILSIKTLQASAMSMLSLQSNLCEMKAGEEVLCVRIRELEQLVSIAAREYDALEDDAVNLRELVRYAAAEKELLMKFSQQIELEKTDFEAKYSQQKTNIIQMVVEARQDAETKQAVRRQVAFKRIGCVLLRRLQYRAWVRWSEYVEQHNRANQACIMMLNRTRKLQILCAFQIWTASTNERKKTRSAKIITRTSKITRRKNVAQRFCRVVSYRSLTSAWRLWKDYVEKCLRFQEALITIAKDNSNCIKLLVWKKWKKYCKQCSRAKQACTKFIKGMLNFGKLRAWRQWMMYVEQRVRTKVLFTNITNKMKKRKALYAFELLLKYASVSKWRALRCTKTLEKTQNTRTYIFFGIWRAESKRSTDMKLAAQIQSLKSSCDAMSQSHTASSARLEEVRFQLLQSTFAKEQFEIDIITKDAQLQISKLQLEKVLQETKHEHQQLVLNFEQQSQKMQMSIHDVSCESQLRHARILHLEHELQHIQLVYSDLTSTMEQQNLRISNLVLHQEDLRKQNVTITQESEQRISDLESKLKVASHSNRELSEQIIDLSDQIQQKCKCLLQRDSVTAVLQTKLCDQENEISSLTKTTESLQALISFHISAVSSLIRDMLSTSYAIGETATVTTLDEVRVFIQRCWDARSEEVQELKSRLVKYEQLNSHYSQEHSILKAEHGSLKDRCISDYKSLHMRLQEQAQLMETRTTECSQLKTLYENDMGEVRSLTGVLHESIASLQLKLAHCEEHLRWLLRSELLEVLCLALVGSRVATRSDVITAFWNEKPETRVQLLDWFYELQTSDTRGSQTSAKKLMTQHDAHWDRF